jgi:hypothetical protein
MAKISGRSGSAQEDVLMFLEFRLPRQLTHWAYEELSRAVYQWSVKQGEIPYRTKVIKYNFRITFEDDRFYTLFALTWQSKGSETFWTDYRIITDLNNRQS